MVFFNGCQGFLQTIAFLEVIHGAIGNNVLWVFQLSSFSLVVADIEVNKVGFFIQNLRDCS